MSLGIQHYRFRLAPPGDIIGAVGLFGGLHVGAHPHTLPEGEEVRLVYVTGNAGLTFTPSRRVGLWAGLGASSRHVSHEQLGPRSRLAPNLLVGLSAHATSRLTLSAGAQTTPASLLVGVGYIW